ncbi:MAG: hypothetical protein C4523_02275 [Myxococcales bacterium]|nr:MAG: hypothetical protein C4523_02275 [Myxococcales bacterium]
MLRLAWIGLTVLGLVAAGCGGEETFVLRIDDDAETDQADADSEPSMETEPDGDALPDPSRRPCTTSMDIPFKGSPEAAASLVIDQENKMCRGAGGEDRDAALVCRCNADNTMAICDFITSWMYLGLAPDGFCIYDWRETGTLQCPKEAFGVDFRLEMQRLEIERHKMAYIDFWLSCAEAVWHIESVEIRP